MAVGTGVAVGSGVAVGTGVAVGNGVAVGTGVFVAGALLGSGAGGAVGGGRLGGIMVGVAIIADDLVGVTVGGGGNGVKLGAKPGATRSIGGGGSGCSAKGCLEVRPKGRKSLKNVILPDTNFRPKLPRKGVSGRASRVLRAKDLDSSVASFLRNDKGRFEIVS